MFIFDRSKRSGSALAMRVKKITSQASLFIILFSLMGNACWAQQPVATVSRNTTPFSVKGGNPPSMEEVRAQLSSLQKRRAALEKYLLSVAPGSADYQATTRALQEMDAKLNDLRSYLSESAPQVPGDSRGLTESQTNNSLSSVADIQTLATLRSANTDVAPSPFIEPDLALRPSSLQLPAPACFPDISQGVLKRADDAAQLVISRNDPGEAASQINELLLYGLATPFVEKAFLNKLTAVEVREETKRTDKQVGASARAEGTTSNVEKPGIINFLATALEYGGITKETNDTTLTLKSSPLMLLLGGNSNTATVYKNNDFLNRIDFSASFNLTNKDNELANVRRSQFSEASARIRLSRDNSTRSAEFEKFWNDKIRLPMQAVSIAVTGALSNILTVRNDLAILGPFQAAMVANVGKVSRSGGAAFTAADTTKVREAIVCTIKTDLVDRIKAGNLVIPMDAQRRVADAIQDVIRAEAEVANLNKLVKEEINRMNARPVVTLGYTNKHEAAGSDYSVVKLLFEKKLSGNPPAENENNMTVQADGNLGVSFYHNPDRTINQQQVRDLVAALSFQINSGQKGLGLSELDESQITLSFNGRYQRLLENRHVNGKKADIASAQFKLEIPLFNGLSIPLSVTYTNATETAKKDRVRANFGLTFDADKLLMLKRAASALATQ